MNKLTFLLPQKVKIETPLPIDVPPQQDTEKFIDNILL